MGQSLSKRVDLEYTNEWASSNAPFGKHRHGHLTGTYLINEYVLSGIASSYVFKDWYNYDLFWV